MQEQKIAVFSQKETEFIDLLIKTGTRRYVAATLVCLSATPEISSREIERCADLRQPEVSLAIKYLNGRGWVKSRELPAGRSGRPMRSFSLAVPFEEIVITIEKEKRKEVNDRLIAIRKLRESIRECIE
ncbi:MAG: ArsR family transcriptional regulator [Methanoregula sp.]